MTESNAKPLFFLATLLAACVQSKGSDTDPQRTGPLGQSPSGSAAKSYYGEIFFDLGALDESYSGSTITLSAYGKNVEPDRFYSKLLASKAERDAIEAKNPYAFIIKTSRDCNQFMPLSLMMELSGASGNVKSLPLELTEAECQPSKKLCILLTGPASDPKLIVKEAFSGAAPSPGTVPATADGGGSTTGTKNGGTTPDQPIEDTSPQPSDDPNAPPVSEGSIKSRAEVLEINCRR